MDWQTILARILGSYFSDWTLEEGVAQLILVTQSRPAYHELYMITFEAALEAASEESQEVFDIINEYCYVENIGDAQNLLKDILAEYERQYSLAIQQISSQENSS
ncbi:hypothetical protein [Anthocerotibacter panamensis]|uniref:hypothetical protein n=1 Tax=Anthocerotibacter panamensis TaxID=2857077 RepID=UPI001C403861|nr:hypothetical protein [Anthocerotibacter panamensis]